MSGPYYCHECGTLCGEDATHIVTTVTEPGVVSIVGLSLCGQGKEIPLAVDKCHWAIERMTGK